MLTTCLLAGLICLSAGLEPHNLEDHNVPCRTWIRGEYEEANPSYMEPHQQQTSPLFTCRATGALHMSPRRSVGMVRLGDRSQTTHRRHTDWGLIEGTMALHVLS